MRERVPKRSGLERKLVTAVLTLFLVPTVAASVVLAELYRRDVFESSPLALPIVVVAGLVAMMAYLAVVTRSLGRSLVRTLREMHLGAELIATVNPDHRLDVSTGDEIQALATEINRLADRLREARREHDPGALERERNRLAAVLDAIDDGVVLVALGGAVVLANRAAHRVIGAGPRSLVGLSVDDLGIRDALDGVTTPFERDGPSRDSPRPGDAVDASRGGPPATADIAWRRTVTITATPYFETPSRIAGAVLLLRSSTPLETVSTATAGVPVGVESHGGAGRDVVHGRREFYEFAFLDEVARHTTPVERGRLLRDLTYVVFDTETTGLEPERGDRIVALAAVKVRTGQVRRAEYFDALVNPGRGIPAASTRIHGISDARVATAPPIGVILPAFLTFVGDAVLVGHQVAFDLRFLRVEAERLGRSPVGLTHAVLDTLALSHAVHDVFPDHDLDGVAARFGVAVAGRHSALGDALATADIFVRVLALLEHRGMKTLGDAIAAMRFAGHRRQAAPKSG